jgi:tetratricopeptide (TPR) repeat protein
MNQHVKVLEKEGLSASIYTQPFDVEGEQNGLMTYDREIVKIPFEDLRKIHGLLVPEAGNVPTVEAQVADLTDPGLKYSELLAEYIKGNREHAFLKKLSMTAQQAGDKAGIARITKEYVAALTKPYSDEDLTYVVQVTSKTSDPGFVILKDNAANINKVLGQRQAENKMMNIIYNEAIAPVVTSPKSPPDWPALSMKVASFGPVGEEILLRAKAIHYLNQSNWINFVMAADDYISKYGENVSAEDLNEFAWKAFEKINDKEALSKAVKWSQLLVKHKEEPHYLDTYANLLYKCGRAGEAIRIQEKAVNMSNGNESMKETLAKMRRGEATWK